MTKVCPHDLSPGVFSTGEMSRPHVPTTCRLVCSQQGKCPGHMSPRLVAWCVLNRGNIPATCPHDLSPGVFSTGEMSRPHVPTTCRLVCSQQGKCPGHMTSAICRLVTLVGPNLNSLLCFAYPRVKNDIF